METDARTLQITNHSYEGANTLAGLARRVMMKLCALAACENYGLTGYSVNSAPSMTADLSVEGSDN